MSHARLSPSSAHRWLVCTAAPTIEATLPDARSAYADRGTFGHAMAEHCLTHGVTSSSLAGVPEWEASEYFDHELREAVNDYVTYVRWRFDEANRHPPGAELLLEQTLDLTPWVPESWGTADAVILADQELEVIDLKLGKGVEVQAEGNPQMRLYMLGAYNAFGSLFNFKTVRGTIHQPFLGGVKTSVMPLKDLLAWGETVRRPAQAAFTGPGAFVPGDHCQFCRAAATCRARAEHNLFTAQIRFRSAAAVMRLDEVARILPELDQIVAWASEMKAYALEQAVAGHKVPGHKLVEGRSNRRYTDAQVVIDRLVEAGHPKETITKTEIIGIQEMEKLLGRPGFKAQIGDLVEKPPGKPVLAPETDKRPEISSVADAATVFKPLLGGDDA